MIYESIKTDLQQAMKVKDGLKTDTLRMVLGEVPRLNKKANEKITDMDMMRIINSLIKSETTVLEYSGVEEYNSPYIKILKSYLPTAPADDEVAAWIKENIDFSNYKDKMQAMKDIMPTFKPLGIDGNKVKKIILGL